MSELCVAALEANSQRLLLEAAATTFHHGEVWIRHLRSVARTAPGATRWKPGHLELAQFDPLVASEIQMTLACVVVSPTDMNECLRTFIVTPMNAVGRPAIGEFSHRTHRFRRTSSDGAVLGSSASSGASDQA